MEDINRKIAEINEIVHSLNWIISDDYNNPLYTKKENLKKWVPDLIEEARELEKML